jgi:hypothetical protein
LLYLGLFAFDIYDTDADGLLSFGQVRQMILELVGTKVMETDFSQKYDILLVFNAYLFVSFKVS